MCSLCARYVLLICHMCCCILMVFEQVGLGDTLTREEADVMIDKVDEDGSGEVEFDEFLAVSHQLSPGCG